MSTTSEERLYRRFLEARERTMYICFEYGVAAGLGHNDAGDFTAWVENQRVTGPDPLDALEQALSKYLEASRVLGEMVQELDGPRDPGVVLLPPEWPPKPGLFRRLLGLLGLAGLVGCGSPATPTPLPTPTAIRVPLTAAAGTPCAPDWTFLLAFLGAIVAVGLLCWFGAILSARANGEGWARAREWQFKAERLVEENAALRAKENERQVELELDNSRLREEVALLSKIVGGTTSRSN